MKFRLTLSPSELPALLPFNYQYPLSSAIYKTIQHADETYAAFLHNRGYAEGYKNFKLFTFSDLRTPFRMLGDRMQLLKDPAELLLYVPEAAENFYG